jgi:hypothetical protein
MHNIFYEEKQNKHTWRHAAATKSVAETTNQVEQPLASQANGLENYTNYHRQERAGAMGRPHPRWETRENKTTYQKQRRILREQNDPNPNPRQKILHDLELLIKQFTTNNHEVILMWDANESITSHKSSINKLMSQTNMTPINTTFPQASYSRESSCIDFILSTPSIQDAIVRSGYLAFYEGIWSLDHKGAFVDLHIPSLFQCDTTHTRIQTTKTPIQHQQTTSLQIHPTTQKMQYPPERPMQIRTTQQTRKMDHRRPHAVRTTRLDFYYYVATI